MCAIIGSFDKVKLFDLIKQNQHRGKIAFSLSTFNLEAGIVSTQYGNGEFDFNALDRLKTDGSYIVCHLQSPTGAGYENINYTHPSIIEDRSYLWHNGILIPKTISRLQCLFSDTSFDTELLHRWIYSGKSLDEIEGSFACLYVKGNTLKIFRSKHAKLFIDEHMTVSSERFEDSKCINADRVYKMDIYKQHLSVESYFKTKRCNIVIKAVL